MKSNILKLISLLSILLVLIISSCEKPDPDTQSAEDDARGSYIMSDAFAVANNEAGGGSKSLLACPEVLRDLINRTVIITFDDCEYRGVIRSGEIHVTYTPNLDINLDARAVNISVTFVNYTFRGRTVEGTISTTVGGTATVPVYTIKATNMVITFPNDEAISFDSEMTYTMVDGFGDGIIDNNKLEISGTTNGVNRAGKAYESVYNKVTIDRSCDLDGKHYPVSGTVTITSDKGETVIDYGDGTCDNVITVSNNGVSVEITLD